MALQTLSTAHDAVAGASEVLNRLRGAFMLATRSNSKTIFYTRSRVKDPAGIVEKLFDRQARYGDRYSIRSITDIVGYRLVVLYDDQLEAAFRLAIQVLRNCHSSEDPLVSDGELWGSIHEIKFFPRSADSDDPYSILYRDLLSKPEIVGKATGDLHTKIKLADPVGVPGSTSSYSSMHIVVYTTSYSVGAPKLVPLELQIRTAVEDIWSEISHENEYKVRKRNAWSPTLKKLYSSNAESVRTLKKQLNSIVPEKMSNIRQTTKSIMEELVALRSNPLAQYNSYILNLAYHIGSHSMNRERRKGFDKYGECIDRIRSEYVQRRDPVHAQALIQEFVGAKEALSRIASFDFSDAECESSFRGLIRLEEARLDAIKIHLLMTDPAATNEDKTRLPSKADELYAILDQIECDDGLHVKPVSMIQYFKYYVFRYGSQKKLNLVSEHLNACHSALKIDPTVDPDGMMVVMATRAFAQNFWENAEEYRAMLKETKNTYITHAMRERYQQALRLAIESRDTFERRRGNGNKDKIDDLIFGASPFQEYTCVNNVVMYATECLTNGVGAEFLSEVRYGIDALEKDSDDLLDFLRKGEPGLGDIWHTAMIGFRVLSKFEYNRSSNASKAKEIAEHLWKEADGNIKNKRIEADVLSILNDNNLS
jgi:ppGpp synthetase/RelA/SpoT-type nucleotidyltranferase